MKKTRGRHLPSGGFALAATLVAAGGAQSQPVFTGNAEADFNAGAVVADPNGVDVGMPLQFPLGLVSGNDLKDLRFQYHPATDTMYVAFNTFGLATDVDSDGDASHTSDVLAALGGVDLPRIGGTESFSLLLDLDEDGIFDVNIGVSGFTNIDGFQVAHFAGNALVPPFAFGPPVAGAQAEVFGSPEPGSPDIEFSVSGWSDLPTSGVDRSASFAFTAFLGSFTDDGIGDDFLPGAGEAATVCLPQPEICNAYDDNCNGQVDEGFGVGQNCDVGIGACLAQGVIECTPEGLSACNGVARLPQPEACDRVDNDCDGSTDEDIVGVCTSNLPGLCSDGHLRCEDGQLACVPDTAPALERCDTLDNDCDGSSDEGLPVGQLCGVGIGACRAIGIFVCAPDGGIRCTGTESDPHAEICDDIDNDCDGSTDEDFNLGDGCSEGVGACLAQGETVCDDDGSTRCTARPGAPAAEICNGIDDDCNGRIDEGLGLGDGCSLGLGECRANGVIVCQPDGDTACNARPGAAQVERCDLADNDCDGSADEGLGLGNVCNEGIGACADAGIVVCAPDGATTCDATPGRPGVEICNNIDDNCDGSTDEALARACGSDIGACDQGLSTCVAGVYGACVGDIGPAGEICNGIDDSCDGQSDEGFNLGAACFEGVGACGADGVVVCAANGGTTCSAQPGAAIAESCNAIDDDCDGSTDEGLGLGRICNEGIGACADTGVIVCAPDGRVTCDATPGRPGVEICNNIDDNCDGSTDEALARACGSDIGACDQGLSTCVAGVYGACVGDIGPAGEICNGIDDSCDGQVDEGFNLGAACFEGVGACGADGVVVCDANGGTECSAQPGVAIAESCNGNDDDCDGSTDEGLGLGRLCNEGVGACADAGVIVCAPDGRVTCDATPGQPGVEICNGIDDNCDGSTDEQLARACGSDIGACAQGLSTCVAGVYGACVGDIGPAYETCNGIDDSCDGQIDEDFNLGALCNAGIGACAAVGRTVCSPEGDTLCDAAPAQPSVEVCNNIDDNCDGAVDEGLTVACGSDVGACSLGASVCLAGAFGACEGSNGPVAELCNGVNDNCDGTIDEGFFLGDVCTRGEGACAVAGEVICNLHGGTVCSEQPLDPTYESCNAIDDDCDGDIDEGFGGACSVGVGACRNEGMLVCAGNALVRGQELLINGGFEQPVLPDDWEYYFEAAAWPGWTRTRGTATELQQISTAAEGEQYAELDSDSSSCFEQTVATVAGQPLTLSLAFSARTGVVDNQVEVIWNGDVIAVLNDDGTGRADTAWQAHTFAVVAVGPESVLAFCDASQSAPLQGGFIDDVSLRTHDDILCDAVPGEAVAETCNGIDDDCDGSVDEDFALGLVCNAGIGACAAAGLTVCAPDGTLGCDAQAADPIAESCNGIDDDCDGGIDNGLGLGAACNDGVGACADVGVVVCAPDGGVMCDGEPGTAAYEACNGIDDDCDGAVDEDFRVGTPCQAGVGVCGVVGQVVCAADGSAQCNAQPVVPVAERCNAHDDDCDGLVDEGFGLGGACAAGQGACAAEGVVICDADGGTSCTAQPGAPQYEVCDGADNDCDGEVDEEGCAVCEGQARTQSPGDWGGRGRDQNAGAWRNAHFDACFPNHLVLGDSTRDNDRCYAIELTSAHTVERFLPNGGRPAALRRNALNPRHSGSGVLSGQLAAAVLSVGFDRCEADFGDSEVDLGDFVVNEIDSPCHGWTVDQVIDEGHAVLSGCGAGLDPAAITGCLALINENFLDGIDNNGHLCEPDGGAQLCVPGEERYSAIESAHPGHALVLRDFPLPGRNLRLNLHNDAELRILGDGATLIGTGYKAGTEQTWNVNIEFSFRGQGDAFGPPRLDLPAHQPVAVTDLWRYFDLTEGTLTRGNKVVHLSSAADGQFPLQLGMAANGANPSLGASARFSWDMRACRGGFGDLQVNLDDLCDDAPPPEEVCD